MTSPACKSLQQPVTTLQRTKKAADKEYGLKDQVYIDFGEFTWFYPLSTYKATFSASVLSHQILNVNAVILLVRNPATLKYASEWLPRG